jgi:hypothetical protein
MPSDRYPAFGPRVPPIAGSPHYEVSIVEGVVSRTLGFWEEPDACDPDADPF